MVEVKITSKHGLHARPASVVVKEAGAYSGEVYISKNDNKVSAKSIMKVMSLGIVQGDTITIEAVGENSDELEAKLKDIIEKAVD